MQQIFKANLFDSVAPKLSRSDPHSVPKFRATTPSTRGLFSLSLVRKQQVKDRSSRAPMARDQEAKAELRSSGAANTTAAALRLMTVTSRTQRPAHLKSPKAGAK